MDVAFEELEGLEAGVPWLLKRFETALVELGASDDEVF